MPLNFTDEESNRKAKLLYLILLLTLVGVVVYAVCVLLLAPQQQELFWPIGLIVPQIVVVYGLLRIYQLRFAIILLLAEMWVFTTLFCLATGGAYEASFHIYIVCIILASLLLGKTWGLALTGLCIVTSLGIFWLQVNHFLPPALVIEIPLLEWLPELLVFGIAALLLQIVTNNLNNALATAVHHERGWRITYQAMLTRTQELMQREAVLSASEERYRKLVEISPDAILINRQGQIVYANPACLRLFQASNLEQLLGRTSRDLVHPADYPYVQQAFEEVLRKGGIMPVKGHRLLRLDGEEIDIELTAVAFETPADSNNPAGMALQIILRDITERKRIENKNIQLMAKLDTQSVQLRALNHRLAETQEMERKRLAQELHDRVGQNLTAIGLDVNFVRLRILPSLLGAEKAQARLEDAAVLIEETTELIRDVLADLRPPVLDSYGLASALKWYSASITKRTGLVFDIQEITPLPQLAEQLNLVLFRIAQEAFTNIVKHAQATQVTVRLAMEAAKLRFVIADNGCGMNAALYQHSVNHQSWGLLNMQERAEAVNGQCWIESSPDKGTKVITELPL